MPEVEKWILMNKSSNCHNQTFQDKCHQVFPHYPERSPEIVILDSHNKVKGNFYKVLSPWYPANKGAGFPKFSCSRNALGWHQPWFPNGTIIYKRREGIYLVNLKREKLLPTARATVAIKKAADGSVTSYRNTGQCTVLKSAAAGLVLLLATSVLESSLSRHRQPSQSNGFRCPVPGAGNPAFHSVLR